MAGKRRRLKTMRRKVRIYTDEKDPEKYFEVACDRAIRNLTLKREKQDVLNALRGSCISCMDANMTVRGGAKVFGHPVYLAVFTRSVCYIVDKISKGGVPVHAVAYEHDNGRDIELHDKMGPQAVLDAGLAEKTVRFFIPRDQSGESRRWSGITSAENTRTGLTGSGNKPRLIKVLRGAKRRAVDAGITPIVFHNTEAVA